MKNKQDSGNDFPNRMETEELEWLHRRAQELCQNHQRLLESSAQALPQENGDNGHLFVEASELMQQMQAKALQPVVGVRYVRDAFYHSGSDLRLTFDRNLEAIPPDVQALCDPHFCGIPALEPGSVIMEIKYGSYLPAFLRKMTRVQAPQLSFSKYALCREKMR